MTGGTPVLQRGGATLQTGVGRADLQKHRFWYKPSSTPYERAFRALRDVNPITRHFAYNYTLFPNLDCEISAPPRDVGRPKATVAPHAHHRWPRICYSTTTTTFVVRVVFYFQS